MLRLCILLLALGAIVASCSPANTRLQRKSFYISLSSRQQTETIYLQINDSLIINNEDVEFGQFGAKNFNQIRLKKDTIHLSASFYSVLDSNFNLNRNLSIDTTLYIKNGKFVNIGANCCEVIILQHDKIINVE